MATIVGTSQLGLPNFAEFGFAVGGGVYAGLLSRDFDTGMA